MREIKFRAWDKTVEKIIQLIGIHRFNEINESSVLMQYTGLKDKNDKEIYEGDIVRWADTEGTVYIKVVAYSVESLSFQIGNISYSNLSVSGYFQTKLEVIGNIYENPELQ